MLLQIAKLDLKCQSSNEMKLSDPFTPFIKDGEMDQLGYLIDFEAVESLLPIDGNCVYSCDTYQVIKNKNGYQRIFISAENNNQIYAIGNYDFSKHVVKILFLEKYKNKFKDIQGSFYHIGFESLLLHENRVIFHSCCVDTLYGGILFSGNSGVGKSTQGDLWVKYKNARIINGDRTILIKDKNWIGYGSPYAGSSRYYINEGIPIKAIVFLKQSKQCEIRKLKPIEAYKKIYAQMIVNEWNQEYVTHILNMIDEMIIDLNVYELACTPDIHAVNLLTTMLEEGKDE